MGYYFLNRLKSQTNKKTLCQIDIQQVSELRHRKHPLEPANATVQVFYMFASQYTFFYKHQLYKHLEPQNWLKNKHILSTTPSFTFVKHQFSKYGNFMIYSKKEIFSWLDDLSFISVRAWCTFFVNSTLKSEEVNKLKGMKAWRHEMEVRRRRKSRW